MDNLKLISPFEISKGRFQEVAHGFNPYPFLNSSTMSLILRRTLRCLLRHLKYTRRIKVMEKNRIDQVKWRHLPSMRHVTHAHGFKFLPLLLIFLRGV